ncbi:alpha/beta fold hydrolase [Shewanella sp. KX20019]|uniref:alpha/beta hydrolase n=1 Tax=Shewanella sp. KX20019 TaxID=2803864 RepID=UPI001929441D|nr:alpha/beta fold hydrolase [Shewanella sp. KX20019]QQX78457.1 alpha/beta fold hydrolase [Shewanella sp. KX20019]
MDLFCGQENEITIQLPHITLSAKLWGSQDKPLILALHGWLDNANSFLPLSRYLTNYQIMAIDWPGHGLSEHRPGKYPLHWIDYLYDLDALLDALPQHQQPIAILGHSLGGIIASAYTSAFPEKVDQLILIEALSPLYEKESKTKQRLNNSFVAHRRYLQSTLTNPSVYQDISVAVNARHKLTALDVAWCEVITQRNMKKIDSGVCWRSDPRLKLDSPLRLVYSQVDALMQQHEVETLLVFGHQGFSQLKSAIPAAKSWFKQLEVRELEGDHHLHMGNAKEVSVAIENFLTAKG